MARQLSAMGMEMCCIYLALNLARRFLGLWYPIFILIFLSYLLSFLFQLTLTKTQGVAKASKISASAGVVMVAIVAALALWERLWRMNSWSGEDVFLIVLQVGLAGLCCWLGSALLRYGSDYREACGRFQIRLLVLFVLASIDDKVYPAAPLFFLLAYLSLALTRWEGSILGAIAVLKPYSWRVLLLGTGGVFLASGLLFVALSPGLVQAIVDGLRTVGAKILGLLEGIDVPDRADRRIDIGPAGCSMKPPKEELAFPAGPPPWGEGAVQISPVFLWFLLFLLVVSVLCLVFFTVKKLRARAASEGAMMGRVEIFQSPKGLFAAATGLLKRLWQALHYWLARILRHVISIKSGPQRGALITLRTLYSDLLKWGAQQGLPRHHFQTPLEYLKTICFNFPDKERELSFITEAYLKARYSRNPPGYEVLEAAGEAWRFVKAASVKRTGRGSRKEKP
ncbi:MAG: DUF4129 domain-containing protein [Pseudomonadota bacterium]